MRTLIGVSSFKYLYIFEIMIPNAANTLNLFEGDIQLSGNNVSLGDKIAKMIATRKKNTSDRNDRIVKQFNHKYNVERKRYDDVVAELCSEFSLAKSTIENVIKN
jgi:hypothetical protein